MGIFKSSEPDTPSNSEPDANITTEDALQNNEMAGTRARLQSAKSRLGLSNSSGNNKAHRFGSHRPPLFQPGKAITEVFISVDANVDLCEGEVRRVLESCPILTDTGVEIVRVPLKDPGSYKVVSVPVGDDDDEHWMGNDTESTSNDATAMYENLTSTDEDQMDMSGCEEFAPREKKTYLAAPEDEPDITDTMKAVNDEFLSRLEQNQTLELSEVKMIGEEIRELRETEAELVDSVLDFYLKLIAVTSQSLSSNSASWIYPFKCSFYRLLSSEDGLEKVKEAADDVDLFSYKYLFIPAWSNSHWRLIVVDIRKSTVSAYNSIKSMDDTQIMNNIQEYLQSIRQKRKTDKKKKDDSATKSWKTITVKSPQQENVHDCGVFTLMFANYLSRNKDMNFEQKDVPYFRERILYECISKRLL